MDDVPTEGRADLSHCFQIIDPGDKPHEECPLEEVLATGIGTEREVFDESLGKWCRCGVFPLESGDSVPLYLHTFQDVSRRVAYETEILRLNRALRTLIEAGRAVLSSAEEQDLMDEICRIAVEVGGFRYAWVGRAEQDSGQSITPVAWYGSGPDLADGTALSWAPDSSSGAGPTATAIRTGQPHIARGPEQLRSPACRGLAKRHGYKSMGAFPLLLEDQVFGTLTLYAEGDQAFLPDETQILTELADNLAFGLRTMRAHARSRQAERELAESEDRYGTLVESAPLGIAVHTQGRITYANQAAADILGAGSTAGLLGKNAADFVHPGCRPIAEARMAAMLRTKMPTPTAEEMFLRLDGESVQVEVTGVPLIFEGQVSALVLFQDITERKRAEAALRENEKKLRQSHKLEAIGRLAGGIAHDFNNLLTTVTGSAEMVLSRIDDPPPEVQNDIDEIRSAAGHAANLTRQLLAFSRRQRISPRVICANEVITDLDCLLRRTLGETIELDVRPADYSCPVYVDPSQLEQVLLNLAVNARDAIAGHGQVAIETREKEPGESGGRAIEIRVSDTGNGIDEHVRARIFEPFYTTKDEGAGTGLGLSTVYGIVKQCGGDIEVESTPGQGSTFTVLLPRSNEAVNWHPGRHCEDPSETPRQGSETILIVEDEESVRALAGRILEKQGYRVFAAESAEEALKTFRGLDQPIDLVLTDIVLPRMGGYELTSTLKAEQPEIKALLMSGYAKESVMDERLDGEVGYIEKPFSPKDLAFAVQDILDGKDEPIEDAAH